jgi:ribokinase
LKFIITSRFDIEWLKYMPDVILLGDINIDISALMPAYPTRGGEGVATAVEYRTGGTVFTTSVVLTNIGVSAGIIGRIGTDVLAAKAITDLDKTGVDRSQVQIDNVVNTGLIYIVVNPDGERTMFAVRGANVFTSPMPEWGTYFSDARWYHFSGYALLAQPQQEAAIYGLELAHQNHCRVSLDPNPEPAMRYGKQIREVLPKIDIFLPNEHELIILAEGKSFRNAIDYVLSTGVKSVVVKRGRNGCVIANDALYLEIPAFEIQVKNTTGAGDSFNAGVVLGRMVGLSWAASGVLGNALGAIVSSNYGDGASAVNAGRVIELIESNMFKPEWEVWHSDLEQVVAYLSAI